MDPTNQLDKMRKNQYQESKDITSNILLKKKYREFTPFLRRYLYNTS